MHELDRETAQAEACASAKRSNQKRRRRHTKPERRADLRESAPGKRGLELPPLDVPAVDRAAKCSARTTRATPSKGFPEVSEIEVIRHFTRLSTWNYAIDLGMYPLGSCTMKYNPRVNEFVARLDGIATEHPYQPQELSQGCLKILQLLQKCLAGNHRHGRGHAATGGRARKAN